MIKSFEKDKLKIKIYDQESEMGEAAADYVAGQLNKVIGSAGKANLILATGTSQFSFLKALKTKTIEWDKITVFHLDEYKDISQLHPASFRKYLKDRILDFVQPGIVHLIKGDAQDLEKELALYSTLLEDNPIDIACIGIGENGHIAFNDPPVADFQDPKLIKIVKLDKSCRTQQLSEGWFSSLDEVPREAITLTISAIMKSKVISCVVPGNRKAKAVANTINWDLSTRCPATVLRRHENTTLFLDTLAASQLSK